MPAKEQVDTVVVGGSAAGLATSAALARSGVPHVVLEQNDRVACAWRGHYERLHLHTSRGLSGLPFHPMPRSWPKYPSREQVVEYLEDYVRALGLAPRFGERVSAVRREDHGWRVETSAGVWSARHVVLATGYTRKPVVPELPGQETRRGEILHSSSYRNGARWMGQRVLVVGFGNSGGEIAIDLVEHAAEPAISVRSPVNVVARDVMGIPILAIGIAMSVLPPTVSDALAAPIVRATVGDIRRLGLQKLPYGPNTQIRRHGRIPLLDVGTVDLIRQGRIAVRPGIQRLEGNDVVFSDGRRETYAAIVLATGFRPALEDFVPEAAAFAPILGTARACAAEPLPGLFLCGLYVSPAGMLRQIGIEARRIAQTVSRRRAAS